MDVLENLIEKSDLPQFQKNSLKGFTIRSKERELENFKIRNLVEEVAKVKNLSEILFSNDEVIFYSVNSKDENNWDYKYPIRSIYLKNERWNRTNTVCPSLDVAFLIYLEKKYIGENSEFSYFAMKILGIDSEN